MPDLYLTVRQRIARAEGMPVIVCGNSDYTVHCSFDSEWDAYPKKRMRVCFRTRKGKAVFYDIGMTGNTEPMPVVRDIAGVEIGFYAGDICTTAPARIPCALCITDLPAEAQTPQQDTFNLLMQRLNKILYPVPEQEDFILLDADGFVVLDCTGAVIQVKG